jgi:hypothetical protein
MTEDPKIDVLHALALPKKEAGRRCALEALHKTWADIRTVQQDDHARRKPPDDVGIDTSESSGERGRNSSKKGEGKRHPLVLRCDSIILRSKNTHVSRFSFPFSLLEESSRVSLSRSL